MLISLDHLCLLVMFVTLIYAKLLVVTWVAVCRFPIPIKIAHNYSQVFQFVNCAPISASVADAISFFLILHSMCKILFLVLAYLVEVFPDFYLRSYTE